MLTVYRVQQRPQNTNFFAHEQLFEFLVYRISLTEECVRSFRAGFNLTELPKSNMMLQLV